ncbi:MAG TPA: ABC transporter permease [Methylomirabilota bacterium]|nr:ABC transporter permease [Methylomirabilota bacterium]
MTEAIQGVGPPLGPVDRASAVPGQVPWHRQRFWRTLRRGSGLFNVGFLVVVALAALTAPWITSQDPTYGEPAKRLRPPAWQVGGVPAQPLGTDQLGRDVYTRLVYGARISLAVGLVTALISAVLGSAVGLVAGYFEGRLGTGLMRLADIQLAFPFLLLALAVVAAVGAGLLNVILILGIAGWATFARVVRAQVLSIKQRDYVEAVRAIGAGQAAILGRHVVPNVLTPVIVLATATVANNIVVEASLTFLGLGVQPTIPSWGSMLAEARDYLAVAWWMGIFPGLALMLTVLTINLLGDWLRDYLDPTLRNV